MQWSSYPDRKIIDSVAVGARDGWIRASLQQRDASTELGDLAFLLLELQSLLLDFFVGNTLGQPIVINCQSRRRRSFLTKLVNA